MEPNNQPIQHGVKKLEVITSTVEHGRLRGVDVGDMLFLGDNLHFYIVGHVAGIDGRNRTVALSYCSLGNRMKGDREYPLGHFSKCAIVKRGPQIFRPNESRILEVRLGMFEGEDLKISPAMARGDVFYIENTSSEFTWVGCLLGFEMTDGRRFAILSHQRPETRNLSGALTKGKRSFSPDKGEFYGVTKFEDIAYRENDTLRNDTPR